MQKVIPYCLDMTADVDVYDRNRRLLTDKLTEYGFKVVKPQGAFYLFIKSPLEDARKFSEEAKKFEILIVPSDSFGCHGYARISYCVKTEQITDALPAFKALAEHFGLTERK